MLGGPKKCAKCDKQVYSIEELKCLDKIWHKNCFKCTVCNSLLNMKNYKGFEKQPYCFAHYPQQKHTAVSENPELLRIKENTKLQSNAKYHEDFEKSKGNYTVVADDPETRRVLENSKIISQIKYHEDFEKNIKNKHIAPIVNNEEPKKALSSNGKKNENGSLLPDYKDTKFSNQITNIQTIHNPNSSNTTLIATFRAGEKNIMESQIQRRIGSIADYDPLNYESEKNGYSNGNNFNNNLNRQYLSMQQQNQPQRIINNSNGNHTKNQYNDSNSSNGFNNNYNDEHVDYDSNVLNCDIKTSVYKAIYDYDAKEDDEISFRDGDKFINCEQIDIGWMIGVHEKTGKHGMFPSNYAEPIDLF